MKLFTQLLAVLFLVFGSMISHAQECGYIYVSPSGADSGIAGTRNTPANLTYGLLLVDAGNNHLRIAHGQYELEQDLLMLDDVTLEGGFRQNDWVKTNSDETIFHRSSNNYDQINKALKGIDCQGISAFSIRDITINVDDAPGNGVSVYGIYLNGCTQYTISRCVINTGDASDGLPGSTGLQGIAGLTGTEGGPGEDEGACCRWNGTGGTGSFAGSNAGGDGGLGGEWGGFEVEEICTPIIVFCQWIITPASEFTNPGDQGIDGLGFGGGQAGAEGVGVCALTYANTNCLANAFNHGEDGNTGADGTDGAQGLQGIASVNGTGYYEPGTGTIGDNGYSHGAGGGGGGGGGGKGCEPAALMPYIPTTEPTPYDGDTVYHTAGAGGGGGGGGEGGQVGVGGNGGEGAGGSFCVFVYDNGINGVVQDCFFNPGNGGQGGAGGTGGAGGIGGMGGAGGVLGDNGPDNSCHVGEGGDGGQGGQGGFGGDGGVGSDGTSEGLFQDNGAPVLDPNIYNPWEPDIEVEYFGCTNSMVIVTTNATGNLNWLFGFGAEPQNSENATDTVFYGSPTGFRSLTLIVDGVPYFYANYAEIRDEFTPPEIEADRTTLCVGESITLGTSSTALSYDWTIPTGSITTSDQQNAGDVVFNTPGNHIVELTTTSCCGTSKATDTIHVLETVEVDLGPDQSACFLGDLPILNGNGNEGASYSWLIDTAPTATNQQFLETTVTGDYALELSYGATCTGMDTVSISIYTESPVNLGENTAICAGQSLPILDAAVDSADYAWTFDGNPIGENSQFLEVFVPGNYAVNVTEPNGCAGQDSIEIVVSDPFIDLGQGVITVCETDPFPILDAGNQGVQFAWILNGDTVANTQEFQPTAVGLYTAVLINQYGCEATDDIQLNDSPALNAAFTGPTIATFGNSVLFNDITGGGTSWTWNFGDGSPVENTQNPSHAFEAIGPRPVFMIVGNGFCVDTAWSEVDVLWDCATLGLSADFTLSPDTVVLSGGATVSVTNSSIGATTYSWDFGDGSATESEFEPIHAYAQTGDLTITLYAINYNCTTSTSLPISVVQFGVGIEDSFLKESLLIFPNPARDYFYISAKFKRPTKGRVELNNELGEVVYQQLFDRTGQLNEKLSLEDISNGLYFLNLVTPDGTARTKLIITK
jgi:PKD repeat protein